MRTEVIPHLPRYPGPVRPHRWLDPWRQDVKSRQQIAEEATGGSVASVLTRAWSFFRTSAPGQVPTWWGSPPSMPERAHTVGGWSRRPGERRCPGRNRWREHPTPGFASRCRPPRRGSTRRPQESARPIRPWPNTPAAPAGLGLRTGDGRGSGRQESLVSVLRRRSEDLVEAGAVAAVGDQAMAVAAQSQHGGRVVAGSAGECGDGVPVGVVHLQQGLASIGDIFSVSGIGAGGVLRGRFAS